MKKVCKHLDGWYLRSSPIVIDLNQMNEDFVAEFICNNLRCGATKKFKFDIKNIEEVTE